LKRISPAALISGDGGLDRSDAVRTLGNVRRDHLAARATIDQSCAGSVEPLGKNVNEHERYALLRQLLGNRPA
jgi:hypothetical protein